MICQVVGTFDNAFNELAYRTDAGIEFKEDIVWSPAPSHRLTCNTGVCDFSSGHLPKDRGDSCPDGTVFVTELGCTQCPEGESLGLAVQCFQMLSGFAASAV